MVNCELPSCFWLQRAAFCFLVGCNIQFLTLVTGHCLDVGVRLALPSWIGGAIEMKRVRQAVPLHPGRQSRWQFRQPEWIPIPNDTSTRTQVFALAPVRNARNILWAECSS
jgi:hypothetical protein